MAADRTFLDVLRDLRQGSIIADLTSNLRDVVAAVRATGGAGELTLTIKVKPASKGDVTTLMLYDAVKVKLPKGETGSTILYATDENALQRRDPRQPELSGLREVGTVTQMPPRAASDTPPA